MPLTKVTQELVMKANQYTAQYYKRNKRGQLRKFWFIGNTGVACDINRMLRNLGIKVIQEYKEIEEQ